nr:hypothetical protein [Tanacetum cinerariifolium]
KLETLKEEKEGVDGKLAGLLIASKHLDNLIESQRPSPTVESTLGDDQNRNPSVSETVASPITPKPFIKFVKPKDSQSKSKTELGRDFKLLDDANILLRTHRHHSMYSINLNNIVPHRDLTCLVAKASADECMLWHKRLGHLNFKTMNTLVRHNLVRGLPTKCFKNDHTCTACPKGKQHKASGKSKLVNSVTTPLHTLHMDLFGPTSDETSGILKEFITEIENLKNKKVKIIRREEENLHVEFLENKAIEKGAGPNWLFDIDSLIKSMNYVPVDASTISTNLSADQMETLTVETPIPTVSLPVPTAYSTDSQEPLSDARLISKRVANQEEIASLDNILSLTNRFEDILGTLVDCPKWVRPIGTKWVLKNKKDKRGIVIRNKARLVAQGYTQEEGIDYDEVFAPVARIKAIRLFLANASFMGFTVYQMDIKSAFLYGTIDEEVYVMQPPRFQDPEFPAKVYKVEKAMYGLHQAPRAWYGTLSKYLLKNGVQKVPTAYSTDSQEPSSDARLISKRVANQEETASLDNILSLTNQFEDILGVTTNSDESNGVEADISNMEIVITASPTPTLRIHKDHPKSQIIGPLDTPIQTRNKSKENVWTLVDCPKGVRPIGTKWVLKNKKDEKGIVIRNKARLVAQGHTQEEGIDYDEVFALVVRIKAIKLFLAYTSFMGFTVYQMDIKSAFLYGTIDEKVYVMQPPRFQDPEFLAKVYKVEKAMYGLHQAPRAWYVLQKEDGIFLFQDKYVGDILKKFGYSDVRSSNTHMDKENPWGKDGTGKDVDLHLYRSMVGSLMYLTASRPDIMFACAYSDSDYGGATQDHKSTTGGCQFLGRRLISWQCKKQTIVATSTTVAEYVAEGGWHFSLSRQVCRRYPQEIRIFRCQIIKYSYGQGESLGKRRDWKRCRPSSI